MLQRVISGEALYKACCALLRFKIKHLTINCFLIAAVQQLFSLNMLNTKGKHLKLIQVTFCSKYFFTNPSSDVNQWRSYL